MLSWNEIRDRAVGFSRKWEGEENENAEAQSFWNDFFDVFGVQRRSVAIYEKQVDKLAGGKGFIDLFWPGELIVEHKSKGKDLESAFVQAGNYITALDEKERPRYVVVSDFSKIRLYDLEGEDNKVDISEFELKELSKFIRLFGFMAGFEIRKYKEEDPINIKAVQQIARLYEALNDGNYPKEYLKLLMNRLVFLFFADDAGIFQKDTLRNYWTYRVKEDGSDLGGALHTIFEILNTAPEARQKNLDEDLALLPYVNGGLFKDHLPLPFFNKEMWQMLYKTAEFDWGGVSPAIFGSMFQAVMDENLRRNLGAHYTSEKNILKIINPLFMDDFHSEFQKAGKNKQKLLELQEKMARMKFLDPACGCGNFLVVAYREMRKLELEIIKILYSKDIEAGQGMLTTDIAKVSKLTIENFYGIEIEEFPALIARLALWLTNHQMNSELGRLFGNYFARLPLTSAAHIVQGNSLRLDWNEIVRKEELSFIMGNPPFVGSKMMSEEQRKEIMDLFGEKSGAGVLDYVSGWYKKASEFTEGTNIKCAFVSTNSITQGEQVAVLWKDLSAKGIKIDFAHRTFKWTNEARGKAGVYCVIIGFSYKESENPRIFEYDKVNGEAHEVKVKRINPYLVDAPDVFIDRRKKQISGAPEMGIGNKPIDGGFYLFTPEQKQDFLSREPKAEKFFRRWMGADEFLNGDERWCLWLGEANPEELRSMPEVMRRIDMVREVRLISKSAPTKKLAETPTRFHVENIPDREYLLIPRVSSENRKYIPIGFISPDTLTGDTCLVLPKVTFYHFGILQSLMHMSWTKAICGRLEGRYRYSVDIVYNNFPWPEDNRENQDKIELAAANVLDARKFHLQNGATLADLYDPHVMPEDLLKAHHALDAAVDAAYNAPKFASEMERLEFLFEKYKELI